MIKGGQEMRQPAGIRSGAASHWDNPVPGLWMEWQQSGWCQEQGSEPPFWIYRGCLSSSVTKTCSGMWQWAVCFFTGLPCSSYHCIYQLPLSFNKINDFKKLPTPWSFTAHLILSFPHILLWWTDHRYLVDEPITPLLYLSCTSLIFCFFPD